ncbi:hypothetical protein IEO21_06645 [Rhodonia placenta]|nr:hypothetical protein IEO21_06645 [Postia placenta]
MTVPDHELVSQDGSLKLDIYRVGWQIQRDIRNDIEPWLRYFKVKIQTADDNQIGYMTYRLVNGGYIDDFHEEFQMSEHGAEQLETIGSLLFTKDGTFQPRWYSQPYVGTGIFGAELSATKAKIALLDCTPQDHLFVLDESRRRRVGLLAVRTLLESLRAEGVKFALTWPSVPRIQPELVGTATEQRLLRRNLAFTRKVGFRRVGTSPVFAYMLQDADHPSHQLKIESDVFAIDAMLTVISYLFGLCILSSSGSTCVAYRPPQVALAPLRACPLTLRLLRLPSGTDLAEKRNFHVVVFSLQFYTLATPVPSKPVQRQEAGVAQDSEPEGLEGHQLRGRILYKITESQHQIGFRWSFRL